MRTPVIFVAGSSRSGTTMLNRILGNHSQVLGLHELHFFGGQWTPGGKETAWSPERSVTSAARLLATARRSLWNNRPEEKEMTEARMVVSAFQSQDIAPFQLYSRVIGHLLADAGRRVATDQTPRNIFYARKILDLYPEAVVVQLVRDPRAVLLSQKKRWRQRWLGANNVPWRNALRVFVNYHPYTTMKLWKAAYEAGAELRGHRRYYCLRFEDLLENPREQLTLLCDFLNLSFEPQMLDIPQEGSSNLEHRSGMRGIAKEVAHVWRGKLSSTEIWIAEKMSGSLLKELGYEKTDNKMSIFQLVGYVALYPLHLLGVLLMNPRLALRLTAAMKGKLGG